MTEELKCEDGAAYEPQLYLLVCHEEAMLYVLHSSLAFMDDVTETTGWIMKWGHCNRYIWLELYWFLICLHL